MQGDGLGGHSQPELLVVGLRIQGDAGAHCALHQGLLQHQPQEPGPVVEMLVGWMGVKQLELLEQAQNL